MKKKETQLEIERMLCAGESKSKVFQRLSGQGVSDRVLAQQIASYADSKLLAQHGKLIQAMITISWLQLGLAILLAIFLGLTIGWLGALIATAFIGAFAYLFVWGFTHNKAWAYNATILLTIVNLPKTFGSFMEAPIVSLVGLLLSLGLIFFTWYVRSKIFPDFAFVSPKKIKGSYTFSS